MASALLHQSPPTLIHLSPKSRCASEGSKEIRSWGKSTGPTHYDTSASFIQRHTAMRTGRTELAQRTDREHKEEGF
eukprot:33487-Eustigmatos_ZCMA.PRE.1